MIKTILLIILFAITATAQQSSWKQLSSFEFRWKKNLPNYKFVLEIPDWHDAGDFNRLRILPPHKGKEFIVIDSGGFVDIGSTLWDKKLKERNLAQSEYLYFSPDLIQSDSTPTLILFCWQYASSPGVIHIIQLGSDGKPKEVFSQEFGIDKIIDVDGDGRKELVGKPAYAEEFGYCYESYNPYYVYEYLDRITSPLQYSLRLSKKYNQKYYYGWMGPHYSEDIVVVLRAPGKKKPVVMKIEEADKLFAK